MSGFLHFKFSHFCAIKSLCDCVRLVGGVGRCKFLFMGARSCDTGVVNVHIFFFICSEADEDDTNQHQPFGMDVEKTAPNIFW